MKNVILLLSFLIISPLLSDAQLVVRVVDGDTYQVLWQGRKTVVRLMNVDAPELKQFYGTQARDSVAALIELQTVSLEVLGADLYGRQLVVLRIRGLRLDSLMVQRGWGWHYTTYSTYAPLADFETAAQRRGVGLWACRHPVPPWIWRKLSKRNKRLYEMCPN